MITRLLRTTRLWLRGTAVGWCLRRAGISSWGRTVYTRRLLKEGVHEVDVLGTPLRFVVTAEREITRLDDLTGEADFLKRILAAVRPRGVVYDIGANIGVMSLAVAGHHRDDGVVVHAFEPEPRNAAELTRNITLNGLGGVVVHQCALGASCGTAHLFVEGETGSGAHSLVCDHASAARAVEVEVLAGAEFARRIATPPDLIKIDVEGAELDVLRGLTPLLEEHPPHDVFVEVHPETLVRAGGSREAVRELLEARGYTCVWSQRRGRQFHEHYQHA